MRKAELKARMKIDSCLKITTPLSSKGFKTSKISKNFLNPHTNFFPDDLLNKPKSAKIRRSRIRRSDRQKDLNSIIVIKSGKRSSSTVKNNRSALMNQRRLDRRSKSVLIHEAPLEREGEEIRNYWKSLRNHNAGKSGNFAGLRVGRNMLKSAGGSGRKGSSLNSRFKSKR